MKPRGRTGALALLTGVLIAQVVANSAGAEDLEAATAARMGDYQTAIARWQAFAQQGDADSAYHLAQAYDTGRGVPRDLARAQYWYRTAAANGSGPAAYALGAMAEESERPDGTPQDLDAAVYWYRKALEAGDPRAEERLAALGAGTGSAAHRPAPAPAIPTPAASRPPTPPQPVPTAHPAPPVDPDTSFQHAVIAWRTRGISGKDPSVVAALEAAAKQGHPLAQYDLGYAYEHGLGVPAEPAMAYAWYKRAEASNGPAQLREAAAANRRHLASELSEQDKQAAESSAPSAPVR